MADLLLHLKQRKLVQWTIAYVAFAFALLQGIDVVAQRFGWPGLIERYLILALAIGFFVVLVVAWYHGERGAQKVTGVELLILALLLVIGGVLIWRFGPAVANRSGAMATRPGHAGAAAAATAVRTATTTPSLVAEPIPPQSIAVLPFVNMSGDPKNDYFSDGITEEILNALAQIPDLKVAGRTSAFQFNSKDANLRNVGETLGVADVLVGSVQKAGDEVRINVQLVDTRSGYQRWSEKYDRKLTNIFAIEDNISSAIAGKLRVQLIGGGGQALVAQKAIDPRAHDFYLRGLNLLAARGPGLRDAVAAFQNAVKIDPHYADAWGALAETEAVLPSYLLASQEDALPRAQAYAQRALALNANTVSAHLALGIVYSQHWQWAQSAEAVQRALALAPSDAEAIELHAQGLYVTGQLEPALREIERAQSLDPLSAVIGSVHAWILMSLHRHDEAAAQIDRELAAHPGFALAHTIATMNDIQLRRYARAAVQARSSLYPDARKLLVRGLADPAARAQSVRELSTSPAYVGLRGDRVVFAEFMTLLGERDRALDALGGIATFQDVSSFGQHSLWVPALDPIRNDPRFKAVLKQMGLPYTPKDAVAP